MRIFPHHAEAIFLKARANKEKIELAPLAYHTLLETLVNHESLVNKPENVAKVKKYFRMMKEDGIEYSCKTYTLMITFYFILGATDAISDAAEEIERRGLPYTYPCIKQLLKIHAMMQDSNMVEFYFQKLNTDINPVLKADIDIYCTLIQFYTKINDYDSAYEMLERIIQGKMKNTRPSPKKIIREFLTESRSSSRANFTHKVSFPELMQSCLELGLI